MIKRIFNKLKRAYRISRYRYSSEIMTSSYCSFGEYTYGEPAVYRYNDADRLIVGRFCSIGAGCRVILGGEHFTSRISTYPFHGMASRHFPAAVNFPDDYSRGDVNIGNDVWLGRNVTILSGVTIGDGAVVGAGAVVSKSIPPYAVAAGNPIRILRYRFDAECIRALLRIAWWNWPKDRISAKIPLLLNEDPEAFIVDCLGADWRTAVKE